MKPHIEILPDQDALAKRVADKILERALQAVSERGRFTFVLTGGESPVPLYRTLAEDSAYRAFPWEKTLCFFGDERPVPPDSPQSNYGQAKKTLFHTGLVPEKNIFRFRGELKDTAEAAAEYEKKLRELFPGSECIDGFPRFDVLLLGLGGNGHTASLFPCTEGLREKSRWAIANHVPELEEHRLTLTYPVLNAAREIYLESIVPRKNEIVSFVLAAEEKDFRPFPVQGIAPRSGNYIWFLTEETAPPHLKTTSAPTKISP